MAARDEGGAGGVAGDREPGNAGGGDSVGKKEKEIYSYELPWVGNCLSWSVREDKPYRLAVSSFIEEYQNKVNILQLDQEKNKLVLRAQFDHPYPATKIMWLPDRVTNATDLLASSGDYLRLWEVNPRNKDGEIEEGKVVTSCCLNNNKKTDFCAPLTSLDWNSCNASRIATASIDTTCSVWDIESQKSITQLIAHEKEVFDIAFGAGCHVFASVGADGSARLFDTRALDHSTIVYESENLAPLLRVSWNKQDPNYIATISASGPHIIVLDTRRPAKPFRVLPHNDTVNTVGWAPHSSCHLCSAGEESLALIWDIYKDKENDTCDPILAYKAKSPINWLQWSQLQTDWIGITFDRNVEILKV